MSAWMVSKTHIDLLITAALAWELIVPEQADETGRMLWRECHTSVAYRYDSTDDGELPGPWGLDRERPGPPGLTLADIEGYTFQALEGPIDPEAVLIAARSLDYQSCEHPGWEASAAYRLCVELQTAAESLFGPYRARWGAASDQALKHGEHGAWSADSREVFLYARRLRDTARAQDAEGVRAAHRARFGDA